MTRNCSSRSYDLRFFFFSSRRRHTRLQGDWSSTCALPISLHETTHGSSSSIQGLAKESAAQKPAGRSRSEERRVGKEGGTGPGRDHWKRSEWRRQREVARAARRGLTGKYRGTDGGQAKHES